tara:strand:+ start:990 stop:1325 length:336 start_codon:yes stop_codon:yes gene_type:complete
MRHQPDSLDASPATKKPSQELRYSPSPDRRKTRRKYERLSPASSPGHEKVSRRTLRLSKLTDISRRHGQAADHELKGSPWLDNARINMAGPEVEHSNDNVWPATNPGPTTL